MNPTESKRPHNKTEIADLRRRLFLVHGKAVFERLPASFP